MEVSSVAHECWREARTRPFIAIFIATLALLPCSAIQAQVASGRPQLTTNQNQTSSPQDSGRDPTSQSEADAELQTGTVLTRKGSFREAIPHLLAARGKVANEYAASFNLALCYVATNQFPAAIEILNDLRRKHDGVDVENLLTQGYIGNGQPREALASLQKAAALSPQNEKLYAFVADACMDHRDYTLGLQIVDIGLHNLPQSARLHYERAMFLTELDRFDEAKPQFELAVKLTPGSEIGYLAAAQQALFDGDLPEAIRSAREAVKKGYENPALLTVLGDALIRFGAAPGQPEFAEAQTALERAVLESPSDPASQIALGSLYLTAGRLNDAIAHLKIAQQLEPGRPSIYANLAKAYQRQGDAQSAREALSALEKLNQDQANQISSAPGERKMGYAGRSSTGEEASPPHN